MRKNQPNLLYRSQLKQTLMIKNKGKAGIVYERYGILQRAD